MPSWTPATRCTAFLGHHRLAAGELRHVALKAKQAADAEPNTRLRVFDDSDGSPIELDLRGAIADVIERLQAGAVTPLLPPADPARRGRGRPKLGVVAREVTLLPRHWQWLNAQPGGASVALRGLVEDARRTSGLGDRRRGCQEAAYRFMHAMGGELAGFEAATRALFAGDVARLETELAGWPDDIRDHALWLAADALHH